MKNQCRVAGEILLTNLESLIYKITVREKSPQLPQNLGNKVRPIVRPWPYKPNRINVFCGRILVFRVWP